MYKKLLALATFLGTVIGVGLFGLPYTANKVGFGPIVFYFIILGLVAIVIHLMFGEVVLRTKGFHRLPGYVGIYLGKKWKIFSSISGIIGISGALLAYIIVGGKFLSDLIQPWLGGQEIIYTAFYFGLGILLVYLGTRSVSKTELIMLFFFFAIVILLFAKTVTKIDFSYFGGFDAQYLFLPYGVILFSLWGASIIPETQEILGEENKKSLKPILILGLIISVITYLIFIFSILGVTGPTTTTDALSGLISRFGNGLTVLTLLFGILTTFTSFLALGITLKKIFWYDLKLSHFISWLIVTLIPIGFYLLGFNSFIIIIGFVGAVTLGFDTITTILCFQKAKLKTQQTPPYSLTIPKAVIYCLVMLFLVGIITELSSLIK